jgi:ABC-type amino acid transport substrate-binding protein
MGHGVMTMKILAAIALFCACLSASAQSPVLDRIRQTGVIRLGYIDAAAPFSIKGADGEPQGYSVDLCRAVAEGIRKQYDIAKLAVQWTLLTLQDRIEAVRSGRVDLECSTTTWTLTRQESVDFSLITFIDGVSILSKSRSQLYKFGDFEGRRIAVITGTTAVSVLSDALRRRSIKAEVVPVANRPQALKMIEAGEVDGLASDRIALIGTVLRDPGETVFRLLDEDFSVEQYALALPKGNHDFRLAVNRVLARLYRTGDIAPIYNRWLGPLGPPSMLLTATYFVQAISE